MSEREPRLIFGPVPSRRLGRSLGINNIPPKVCSYACVYCQLGRAIKMQAERQPFYPVDEILEQVARRTARMREENTPVDFLTVVPDGEPTLDERLDDLLRGLSALEPSLAVISNASLVSDPSVRRALSRADWVSLKVDAVSEAVWRKTDRPVRSLDLDGILEGALAFRRGYDGTLVTETMLVGGLNDRPEDLEEVAAFLQKLEPDTAYISVPTRPPAEPWVAPPDEQALTRAYQLFSAVTGRVDLLTGYEGTEFDSAGSLREDLLAITSVHPMRDDAVEELLEKHGAGWPEVDEMVEKGSLVQTEYRGRRFFMRRLRKPRRRG